MAIMWWWGRGGGGVVAHAASVHVKEIFKQPGKYLIIPGSMAKVNYSLNTSEGFGSIISYPLLTMQVWARHYLYQWFPTWCTCLTRGEGFDF